MPYAAQHPNAIYYPSLQSEAILHRPVTPHHHSTTSGPSIESASHEELPPRRSCVSSAHRMETPPHRQNLAPTVHCNMNTWSSRCQTIHPASFFVGSCVTASARPLNEALCYKGRNHGDAYNPHNIATVPLTIPLQLKAQITCSGE